MKVIAALIGWLIGIVIGALAGGLIFMVVLGDIFPVLGYWEWIRISFVATWFIGGGASLNAVKTAQRRTI